MRYGEQIGRKFDENGAPLRYPGNTVLSDLTPENPAYAAMRQVRAMLSDSGLARLFIPLPEDSYHMTVIRGVNDRVREPAFWPPALPLSAPMEDADAFVFRAVASVPPLGTVAMRFARARFGAEDARVLLRPADEATARALRAYRDSVADALGFRLPGHDAYTCHLTFAYTLRIPEAEDAARVLALAAAADAYLSDLPPFALDPPYFARYADMLRFSRDPIAR